MNMIEYRKIFLQRVGFCLIALCVGWVYWPSLLHVARSDHLAYFAETSNQKDWFSLAICDYDINRWRVFNSSDEILFRPLLFFILGTEKFIFGNNFPLWQLFGVVLHMVVVYWILKILLEIRQGFSAVLWTALFSLFFMNMEMVIWQHINPYLVFICLILAALYHVYKILVLDAEVKKHIYRLALALALACFIYEVANCYAVLIAAFLWFFRKDSRRYVKWILLPVLIYIISSYVNFALFNRHADEFSRVSNIRIDVLLFNFVKTIAWWFYVGIFPYEYTLALGAIRTTIVPADALVFKSLHWYLPSSFLMIIGLILYVFYLCVSMSREILCKRAPFLGLLASMIIVFTAVIVLGREQTRDIANVLRLNLYYMYIFWIWLFILFYALLNLEKLDKSSFWIWIKNTTGLVLLSLIIINAQLLYKANYSWAQTSRNSFVLVDTIEKLIREKGSEKDFSFFVDPRYPGNYVYSYVKKNFDPQRISSLVEIMYPQYLKPLNQAKYRFIVM